jgi:UDP-2,4-diacetamido-2,4,6-trideoxy-beta-L-altropyranose hydrolase
MCKELSIAIHADSGKDIGIGHLKRCLCVAEELRRLSYKVEFLIECNSYSSIIRNSGFLPTKMVDARRTYEMIIVDKYYINDPILNSYKKKCKILVRIDDAAPFMIRDRISDVLINGNPYAYGNLYDGFVRKDCHLIVGGNFVPMDRRFCAVRNRYRIRKMMNNIAISFGSSYRGIMDYTYEITKRVILSNLSVNIFVLNGKALNDRFDRIAVHRLKSKLKLLPFIDDVGSVFAKADIIICSASTTCWQVAAIGIPFIVFQTADNQALAFEYIQRTKIGIALDNDSIRNGGLEREILALNRAKRAFYSEKSRKKIDCKGSERIAKELSKIISGSHT